MGGSSVVRCVLDVLTGSLVGGTIPKSPGMYLNTPSLWWSPKLRSWTSVARRFSLCGF